MSEEEAFPRVCIMPTWEQNTRMLCDILRDGTPKEQETAEHRIIQMAKLLDQMDVEMPRS